MKTKQPLNLEESVDTKDKVYIYKQITRTFVEVCNKDKENKKINRCKTIVQ